MNSQGSAPLSLFSVNTDGSLIPTIFPSPLPVVLQESVDEAVEDHDDRSSDEWIEKYRCRGFADLNEECSIGDGVEMEDQLEMPRYGHGPDKHDAYCDIWWHLYENDDYCPPENFV